MTVSSLDARSFDRGVRNDAALDEELAAAWTAGPQPLLVEPQEIGVGRARRALAHLGQDVDEVDEPGAELGKNRREGIGLDAAQRVVRAAANGDVVIDVDKLAIQRVGKESGDEQRHVADFFQAGALLNAGTIERAREPYRKRRGIVLRGSDSALEKTGEQLHDVIRRQLLGGETLMRERAVDQLLEVFDSRLAAKDGFTH